MYAYLHPTCGAPAWLTIDKPQVGVNFLSAKPLRLDYTPKDMTQGCTCEFCGENMFGQAANVDYVVNYIEWKIMRDLERTFV